MTDDTEVLDRLDRYAKACARNVLAKFDLGHDRYRAEDIAGGTDTSPLFGLLCLLDATGEVSVLRSNKRRGVGVSAPKNPLGARHPDVFAVKSSVRVAVNARETSEPPNG